jgi:hypothetical protein
MGNYHDHGVRRARRVALIHRLCRHHSPGSTGL